MVGLLEFIREWIDIRRESKNYCRSCETLREQLNMANHEKKVLLERLINPPMVVSDAPPLEIPSPIIPKIIPWAVKKQMLEQEDRAKAAAIRKVEEDRKKAEEFKQKNPSKQSAELSIEELEKELAIGDE